MKLRVCFLSKLQHRVEPSNTQFKEAQVTYYKYLVDLSICYKLPQISSLPSMFASYFSFFMKISVYNCPAMYLTIFLLLKTVKTLGF